MRHSFATTNFWPKKIRSENLSTGKINCVQDSKGGIYICHVDQWSLIRWPAARFLAVPPPMPRVHHVSTKKCYHGNIQLRRVAKAAILSAALISLFEQWKKHWQNSDQVQPAIAQSTLESWISQFNLQGEQFQVFRHHFGIANSAEHFHCKIDNQNISNHMVCNFLTYSYKFIGNSLTPIPVPSCWHLQQICCFNTTFKELGTPLTFAVLW